MLLFNSTSVSRAKHVPSVQLGIYWCSLNAPLWGITAARRGNKEPVWALHKTEQEAVIMVKDQHAFHVTLPMLRKRSTSCSVSKFKKYFSSVNTLVWPTGIPSATKQRWWRIRWTLCGRPLKFLSGRCAMETMTGKERNLQTQTSQKCFYVPGWNNNVHSWKRYLYESTLKASERETAQFYRTTKGALRI